MQPNTAGSHFRVFTKHCKVFTKECISEQSMHRSVIIVTLPHTLIRRQMDSEFILASVVEQDGANGINLRQMVQDLIYIVYNIGSRKYCRHFGCSIFSLLSVLWKVNYRFNVKTWELQKLFLPLTLAFPWPSLASWLYQAIWKLMGQNIYSHALAYRLLLVVRQQQHGILAPEWSQTLVY